MRLAPFVKQLLALLWPSAAAWCLDQDLVEDGDQHHQLLMAIKIRDTLVTFRSPLVHAGLQHPHACCPLQMAPPAAELLPCGRM